MGTSSHVREMEMVISQHLSMACLHWASWWRRKAGDRSDAPWAHMTILKGFGEKMNPMLGVGGAFCLSWAFPEPAAPLHGDFWCHPTILWGIGSCPSTWDSSTASHQQMQRSKINLLASCWLITITTSCTQTLPPGRKSQQRASLKPAFLPKGPLYFTIICFPFLFSELMRFNTGKEKGSNKIKLVIISPWCGIYSTSFPFPGRW